MKKIKSLLSLLLVVAMLCSVMPMAFAADGDMTVAISMTKNDAGYYEMSVAATSTKVVNQFEVVLSYDTSKIVPIGKAPNGSYAVVSFTDKQNNSSNPGLGYHMENTVTKDDGWGGVSEVYQKAISAYVGTGRSAMYYALSSAAGVVPNNTVMFKAYFGLKENVTESQLDASSFVIETATDDGSFIKQTGTQSGIRVVFGDTTRVYNNAGVASTLTFPNSDKDVLKSVSVAAEPTSVAVPMNDTPVVVNLTASATGLNGNYSGTATYIWDFTDLTSDVQDIELVVNSANSSKAQLKVYKAASKLTFTDNKLTVPVTATCNGSVTSGACNVEITRDTSAVNSVVVTPASGTSITVPDDAATGDAATAFAQFTATVTDQYGNLMTDKTVTWSTTATDDGISLADGKVSVTNAAKDARGDYTVTATVDGKSGTAAFTVALAGLEVSAVKLENDTKVEMNIPGDGKPDETSTAKGVTIYDQYGQAMSDKSVEWSITPATAGVSIDKTTGVVTVSNTAKKEIATSADYTVTATAAEGVTASYTVTVKRATATASSIKFDATCESFIAIPQTDPVSKTYSATVYDQYGAEYKDGGEVVKASVSATEGIENGKIEFDNDSDVIKVYAAASGTTTVKLKATYDSLAPEYFDVTVSQLLADWANAGVKISAGTYGDTIKELVEAEGTTLKYGYSSDNYNKTLTGKFEVTGAYLKGDSTKAPVSVDNAVNAGTYVVTVTFTGSNDEYNSITLTHEYEVTIAPKSIADATVSVTPAEYTGVAQMDIGIEVKLGAKNLNGDSDYEFAITGDCINAAEYTVTVTGKGNYTGEATGTYIIKPAEISINGAVVDDKTYNGKTDDAKVTVTFKDKPDAGVDVDYEVVSAVYASADVADSVSVNIEVGLTGSNYKFADGITATYEATGKITKANAPEVEGYELTVYYRDETDKTVDAADFGITEGEDGWKEVVLTSDFSGGTVISSVTANSDGTLTLTPTASAAAEATDEITVTINSKNYEGTTAKITVKAVDISIPWPAEPTIKEAPVYGDTNANIISGFESKVIATTDKDIPGTITVKDADATPAAGTTAVTLVFTPDNGYGFDGQTFEHSYDIDAVKPATITVTPDDGQSKVYGEDDPDEFTYTVSGAKNGEEVKISGKLEREIGDTVGTYGYSVADMTLEENGAFKPSNYNLEVASGVMFTIEPKPVGVSIEVNTEYVYDGTAKKPGKDDITVIYTDGEIDYEIDDTDYEIVGYGENINAGKGTVKISASTNGNYSFETTSCEFEIARCPVDIVWYLEEDQSGTANGDGTFTFVYNGEVQYPAAKYTPLTEDEGCAISYGGALEPSVGGYTATATCEDPNYVPTSETERCDFIIVPATFDTAEEGKIESSLSGRTRVGQELTAVITMNGVDVTNDFDIVWYALNEDGGLDEPIGDESTLELTNDHKGMKIYYVATSKDRNIVLEEELQTDPSDKITKRKSSDSIRRDEEEEIVVRVEDLNAAQRENFTNLLFTYGPYADIKLGFSDVAASAWYYDYVTDMANAGVINGYPDGTFRPEGDVTWGETLKLVMKAVGYPDIPAVDSHWASGYMATAIADLLISGEVDLDAAITREDVANLTAQALKLAPAGIEYPFEDNAPEAAVALYAAGIITGSLDNGQLLFRAESTITRAEMAAIIYRVYNAK